MSEQSHFPMVSDPEYDALFADLGHQEKAFISLVFGGLAPTDAVRELRLAPPDTARDTARNLMRRRAVKDAMVRLCIYYSEHQAVTPAQVVMLLKAQAFHDPGDIYDVTEDGAWVVRPMDQWPLESRLAVQQVITRTTQSEESTTTVTTVKFADRQHAAELLGRHLHMFDQKGTGGSFQLVVNMDTPPEAAPKPVQRIEGIGLAIEYDDTPDAE